MSTFTLRDLDGSARRAACPIVVKEVRRCRDAVERAADLLHVATRRMIDLDERGVGNDSTRSAMVRFRSAYVLLDEIRDQLDQEAVQVICYTDAAKLYCDFYGPFYEGVPPAVTPYRVAALAVRDMAFAEFWNSGDPVQRGLLCAEVASQAFHMGMAKRLIERAFAETEEAA